MVTKLSSTSTAGSLAHSPALARVREAGLVLAGTLSLILIGQITIPLPFTPVPITMGTFAALGVGAVLGSRRGALSALLLGALAAVGAPVLHGWKGGAIVTFGYVVGYVLIALMLLASASVYVPGLIWLKVATGASWSTALSLGLVPFIAGDILKSVVATGLLPARSRLR